MAIEEVKWQERVTPELVQQYKRQPGQTLTDVYRNGLQEADKQQQQEIWQLKKDNLFLTH